MMDVSLRRSVLLVISAIPIQRENLPLVGLDRISCLMSSDRFLELKQLWVVHFQLQAQAESS